MSKLVNRGRMAALTIAAACWGGSASATDVSVNLGESAELLTLYGLGPIAPGIGSFAVGQGTGSFDGSTTTYVLSGAITGGTAGFDSGTYSFVTTYDGPASPMAGPNAPTAQTNPNNLDAFFYRTIDPSTRIVLNLFTQNGNYSAVLFENDNFVPGASWFFQRVTSTCTGVQTCTQNNVGLTPGATIYGPVVIGARFIIPDTPAVPEPASWAMMVLGIGALGSCLRLRRSGVVRFA